MLMISSVASVCWRNRKRNNYLNVPIKVRNVNLCPISALKIQTGHTWLDLLAAIVPGERIEMDSSHLKRNARLRFICPQIASEFGEVIHFLSSYLCCWSKAQVRIVDINERAFSVVLASWLFVRYLIDIFLLRPLSKFLWLLRSVDKIWNTVL